MFAPFKSQASAYTNVHLEASVLGAGPQQLVTLLLDGAIGAIASAAGALQRSDLEAKRRHINKAVGIISEGLRGNLDMEAGGEVAQTLSDLYACVLVRLTRANVENDAALLHECVELLKPLREAWAAMKHEPLAA